MSIAAAISRASPGRSRSATRGTRAGGAGRAGVCVPPARGAVRTQRARPDLIYNSYQLGHVWQRAAAEREWPGNFTIDTEQPADRPRRRLSEDRDRKLVRAGGGCPVSGTPPHEVELYRVAAASQLSRADFGIERQGHASHYRRHRLSTSSACGRPGAGAERGPDAGRASARPTRSTASTLALGELQPGLGQDQLIAVSGKRQRVAVGVDTSGITFDGVSGAQGAAGRVLRDDRTARRGLSTASIEPVAPQDLDPAANWRAICSGRCRTATAPR